MSLKKQLLLAMKRAAGEKTIPKLPQQDRSGRMSIDNLLNPEPAKSKDRRRSKEKSQIKGRARNARFKRQKFHADRPERYDVVSALMNIQSGVKFRQLLQDDANSS